MSNQLQTLRDLGQSVWLDFISRHLITSGELGTLVHQGLGGVTSNPSITCSSVYPASDRRVLASLLDNVSINMFYEFINSFLVRK